MAVQICGDRMKQAELQLGADFDGPVYEPEFDKDRLSGQIRRVFDCMRSGRWKTLSEIERATGDPAASISAQLRHLRKKKFGSHEVDKRPRGDRSIGLWEYRLIINNKKQETENGD